MGYGDSGRCVVFVSVSGLVVQVLYHNELVFLAFPLSLVEYLSCIILSHSFLARHSSFISSSNSNSCI